MGNCFEESAGFLAHLESDGRCQPLRDHLAGVAMASARYANKIGAGSAGEMIGLVHDLGKYSSAFQSYLRRIALNQDTEHPDQERGKIDHSTAGAQAIWRDMRPLGVHAGVVAEMLALCVASHHSGLIDCIVPGGQDGLSRRMKKADADSHLKEVLGKAEAQVAEGYRQLLQDVSVVSGVRDIIATICGGDHSRTVIQFKVGLLVRFLFSCLIDADRTDTADCSSHVTARLRQHGRYAEWTRLSDLLERRLEKFSNDTAMAALRRQVSESCLNAAARPKGIYLLTVPTGGGKTLASLRFALNHGARRNMDRVIYVSPYTSIIDQNARVARSILEPAGSEFASIVLEHHSNLTPLKQTWKSKILSENWDSPVVFTTAVQLLEALFGAGTRGVRRMHQLANSILVFDEIQTLPVRCVHMLSNALNFLAEQCGSTVVLCTATQPLMDRVDATKGAIRLSKNPEMMTDVHRLFEQASRHETYDWRKSGGWGHQEAAELAITETSCAGSCLVVVNTKREALSIFKECRANAPGIYVYHLSTGMCPAHRLQVLHRLRKRLATRKPTICVSTQLIEAGVDISFGSAIRALAGLDSIAQTAGRCNRNGESAVGRVHVINLKGELPKALVEIRKAQEAAQRVLDEERATGEGHAIDVSDPRLMERYFGYYFFDRRNEMDYPVGPEQQAERHDTLLNMLAGNEKAVASHVASHAAPPEIFLRQAFKTASEAFMPINSNTRGVIVPYGRKGREIVSHLCSAQEPQKQLGLLKRAQRFTVNAFPYVLEKLQNGYAIHEVQPGTGILYLDSRWYNDDFGINYEGTEEMEFQCA